MHAIFCISNKTQKKQRTKYVDHRRCDARIGVYGERLLNAEHSGRRLRVSSGACHKKSVELGDEHPWEDNSQGFFLIFNTVIKNDTCQREGGCNLTSKVISVYITGFLAGNGMHIS